MWGVELPEARDVRRAMFVVAHPDDSLLFQSPTLSKFIENGLEVVTVHLSAGDNGSRGRYWRRRERGIKAAYAQMAQSKDRWTSTSLEAAGHSLTLSVLKDHNLVSLLFLRLPDGGFPEGHGTKRSRFQSLLGLWEGSHSSISPLDGTAPYTRADLILALTAVMTRFQPQYVATQDYVNQYGDGDHADHYATGYFCRSAHEKYSHPHTFIGYIGYPSSALIPNVIGPQLESKQSVFLTYGAFDRTIDLKSVALSNSPYSEWLQREYTTS